MKKKWYFMAIVLLAFWGCRTDDNTSNNNPDNPPPKKEVDARLIGGQWYSLNSQGTGKRNEGYFEFTASTLYMRRTTINLEYWYPNCRTGMTFNAYSEGGMVYDYVTGKKLMSFEFLDGWDYPNWGISDEAKQTLDGDAKAGNLIKFDQYKPDGNLFIKNNNDAYDFTLKRFTDEP